MAATPPTVHRGAVARLVAGAVGCALFVTACAAADGAERDAGEPDGRPAPVAEEVRPRGPEGALAGLSGLERPPTGDARERLLAAADDAVGRRPRPRDPLVIADTEDEFVTDSVGAWTLALAHWTTGEERYAEAAAAVVDAWVTTTRRLDDACPESGACSTSLMVSRAAPGLVFAVGLLRAGGSYDARRVSRFHAWLEHTILPAASDRENNWGDAGTYLRAVVAAELGDAEQMREALDLWTDRLDLVEADGSIPEEVRRDDAALMYSQEALDYKVAAADVFARSGHDVWDHRGARGGTLLAALHLVARSLEDGDAWPHDADDLRVPTPSGLWPIAAEQWPDAGFDALAEEAARHDAEGHSAIVWTAITHPVGDR